MTDPAPAPHDHPSPDIPTSTRAGRGRHGSTPRAARRTASRSLPTAAAILCAALMAAGAAPGPGAAEPRAAAAAPSGWVSPIRHGGPGGWYARGGVFMHPLLVCAIVGAAFIVERAYVLNRARVDTRRLMTRVLQAFRTEGVEAALAACEDTRGPVASVVHAGLLRANGGPEAARDAIETAGAIEVSFLERGLVVISTVSTIAPMIGFLGTVSSAMRALGSIDPAGEAGGRILAAGIGEALIPTIAGLCIAIPCAIGHSYCVGMIDRFVLEMEEASASLVAELAHTGRR